jgi:hypothetical protein
VSSKAHGNADAIPIKCGSIIDQIHFEKCSTVLLLWAHFTSQRPRLRGFVIRAKEAERISLLRLKLCMRSRSPRGILPAPNRITPGEEMGARVEMCELSELSELSMLLHPILHFPSPPLGCKVAGCNPRVGASSGLLRQVREQTLFTVRPSDFAVTPQSPKLQTSLKLPFPEFRPLLAEAPVCRCFSKFQIKVRQKRDKR